MSREVRVRGGRGSVGRSRKSHGAVPVGHRGTVTSTDSESPIRRGANRDPRAPPPLQSQLTRLCRCALPTACSTCLSGRRVAAPKGLPPPLPRAPRASPAAPTGSGGRSLRLRAWKRDGNASAVHVLECSRIADSDPASSEAPRRRAGRAGCGVGRRCCDIAARAAVTVARPNGRSGARSRSCAQAIARPKDRPPRAQLPSWPACDGGSAAS